MAVSILFCKARRGRGNGDACRIVGENRVERAGWIPPNLDDAVRVRRRCSLPPFSLQDNSAPVTIRTRKFTTNRLLSRRQFVVDVLHSSRPPISRAELSQKLGEIYKVDKARVVPFGFKTLFGGGRSTGFALIYDSEDAQKKFEPRYRLVRVSAPLIVSCQSFSLMTACFHPIGWPFAQGGEGFP